MDHNYKLTPFKFIEIKKLQGEVDVIYINKKYLKNE